MFGLDIYDKVAFQNNFLRNIILKLSYKENRLCSTERNKFIDDLKNDYPVLSDGVSQEIKIPMGNPNLQDSLSIKEDNDSHQVIMRTMDNQKEFVLTNSFLQYNESGHAYKSSEDFNAQVDKAANFLKSVSTSEYKSLQLRKINVVDFSSDNSHNQEIFTYEPIRELLAPHLLCMYDTFKNCNSYIKHNMYNLQLDDNDYSLFIKYGYIVTEKDFKMSNIKGQIILDISIEKRNNFTCKELESEIIKCHNELYNAFRWSISEQMFKILIG